MAPRELEIRTRAVYRRTPPWTRRRRLRPIPTRSWHLPERPASSGRGGGRSGAAGRQRGSGRSPHRHGRQRARDLSAPGGVHPVRAAVSATSLGERVDAPSSPGAAGAPAVHPPAGRRRLAGQWVLPHVHRHGPPLVGRDQPDDPRGRADRAGRKHDAHPQSARDRRPRCTADSGAGPERGGARGLGDHARADPGAGSPWRRSARPTTRRPGVAYDLWRLPRLRSRRHPNTSGGGQRPRHVRRSRSLRALHPRVLRAVERAVHERHPQPVAPAQAGARSQ